MANDDPTETSPTWDGLLSDKQELSCPERERAMNSDKVPLTRAVLRVLPRHHSLRNACGMALLITVLPLLVSVACAIPLTADVQTAEGTISDVAQIMGGVYAILLAVIAFSVQLHAQREDENAVMTRYLVRKHGIYWVSAAAVGVTLANLFFGLARGCGIGANPLPLLAFDCVAVPLSLLSSLSLLAITVRDATHPAFSSSLGVLRDDMLRAIAAEQHLSALRSQLRSLLARSRIRILSIWVPATDRKWHREYSLEGTGYVVDVDLRAVGKLERELASLDADCTVELLLEPGDSVRAGSPGLRISSPRTQAQEPQHELQELAQTVGTVSVAARPARVHPAVRLTGTTDKRISRLVQQIYRLGPSPFGLSADLNQVRQRLWERVLVLSEQGPAASLTTTLERLEEFVQHWRVLSADDDPGLSTLWFLDEGRGFAGPLDRRIYDAVDICIRSGDVERVRSILRTIARIAYTAISEKHRRLAEAAISLVGFAYMRGIESNDQAAFVSDFVDSEMRSILQCFRSRTARIAPEDTAPDTFAQERAFLDLAIRLCLSLIRSAMERGRTQDALHFLDRMLEHRRYSDRHTFGEAAPEEENSENVHDYALVVTIGWALHLVKAKYLNAEGAALAVLTDAYTKLPARHELIAIWEQYHRPEHTDPLITQRLGTEWSLSDNVKWRTGEIRSAFVDNAWLHEGFRLALLKARQPYPGEIHRYFVAPPSRLMWLDQGLRSSLSTLASLELAAIPVNSREQTVTDVANLIEQRHLAAQTAYLSQIASAPLNSQQCTQLLDDYKHTIATHEGYINLLYRLGVNHQATDSIPWLSVAYRFDIQRSWLAERGDSVHGVGEWIGQAAITREAVMVFGTAEKQAVRLDPVRSLATLPASVMNAVERLKSQGYAPRIVMLPYDISFSVALFEKPLWQVRRDSRDKGLILGVWHDLEVVRWPHSDATSIAVLDPARMFGRVNTEHTITDLVLHDTESTDITSFLRHVQEARTVAELPNPEALEVRAEFRADCRVTVVDGNAAMAMDVSNCSEGYALKRGGKEYHRVGCACVQGDEDVQYRLVPWLEEESCDRQPCKECNP